MYLDHATIVTPDLEDVRRFFVDIVGLSVGTRPPFAVDGYWLCADGRPVIHLIEATLPGGAGRVVPRIDHIAFRIDIAAEWRALTERLRAADVPFQLAEVPLSGERQLFVALGAGVVVEFVTALHDALHSPLHSPRRAQS
jgi:catechol 2,3-dioxygenase-like lactoylglutathione lyase family enzyme